MRDVVGPVLILGSENIEPTMRADTAGIVGAHRTVGAMPGATFTAGLSHIASTRL